MACAATRLFPTERGDEQGPDPQRGYSERERPAWIDTRPVRAAGGNRRCAWCWTPATLQTFKDGFIPRSINIGIKGDFAPWVGAMIPDVKHPLVIVADEGSRG
jgi:hypothetical protein